MPPKDSVTRTPTKGKSDHANVVRIRREQPARLDLRDAVVRVVIPTAAELTPRQRELAEQMRLDPDAYAQQLARGAQQSGRPGRHAGETDEAHALRDRHAAAIGFARRLVLDLEALRPSAEGAQATPEDRRELLRLVAAVEAATAAWRGDSNPVKHRVQAVIGALEHSRRWKEAQRKRPMQDGGSGLRHGVPEVEPDLIRDEASRVAPELSGIPRADWEVAIGLWPGLVRRGRGGRRTAPLRRDEWTWFNVAERARVLGPDWAEVIFTLLVPHGLAGQETPKRLAESYERDRTPDEGRAR